MALEEVRVAAASGSKRLLRGVADYWQRGGVAGLVSGASRISRKWTRDFVSDRLSASRVIAELAELPAALSPEQAMAAAFELGGGMLAPQQIPAEFVSLLRLVYGAEPRPKRVMEIGSYRGGTLFCSCRLAAPDALVISLDLPGGQYGAGYPAWKRRLYSAFAQPGQTLHLIRGDSHQAASLEQVKRLLGGDRLDFLFIDGDHRYVGVKQDFEMYAPLVRSGGWVAFHDVIPNPRSPTIEVYRFWDEIKARYEHREFITQRERGEMGIGALRMP